MGCASSRQAAGATETGTQAAPAVRTSSGKRITKPADWKYGKSITLHELDEQRQEFWQTRIEGNTYIWQAIRVASEALLANDEDLCNSIIDASAVIHDGGLSLCYDEAGHEYRVPKYCYSNPKDMTSTLEEAAALDGSKRSRKLVPGEAVTIKMQVAPIERRFQVPAQSNNTIKELKQALCDHVNALNDSEAKPKGLLPDNQRIIYCGKELSDSKTLAECGIAQENVLQVYIRRQPVTAA